MRLKNIITGMIGLAVVAVASAVASSVNACVPTTVTATPSAIYITVTVYDKPEPETTVYVTRPSIVHVSVKELPTRTVTYVSTTTKYTTADRTSSLGTGKQITYSPVYDFTVTETTHVTVTVTAGVSKPTFDNGPISYVVIDGATSWLAGKTPAADETFAYASTVITVVPMIKAERTTTVKSTIRVTLTSTEEYTITNTLSPSQTTINIETVGTFTALPTGGWNASTDHGGLYGTGSVTGTGRVGGITGTGTSPYHQNAGAGKHTLVTNEPTYSLFPSSHRASISTSNLAAQSGFQGKQTTLTGPAISSLSGSMTAVIAGSTWSWAGAGSNPSPTPPYANSTHYTSRATAPPYSGTAFSTGGISGVAQSPGVALSGVAQSSGVANPQNSQPSSSAPSGTQVNPSYASSSAVPSPGCGITGDFTLDFDNIPPLAIGNQSVDDVAPLPVFNPYEKFWFSDGFFVVPPPRVPYLPSSKPLLLEFIPNFTINETDVNSGPNARALGWSGDIGNGDHGLTGCFSFNFYGASYGCDSNATDCIFSFTGFRYDRSTGLTSEVARQVIAITACPKRNDCALTPVTLDNTFLIIDRIRMNVTVSGLPKLWWVDDIRLGWTNNTCEAGSCRQKNKIRG